MAFVDALLHGAILVVVLGVLYPAVAWLERRSALAAEERERILRRPLLPLARVLKLLSKRSAPPPGADRPLHLLAPLFGVFFSVALIALIPVVSTSPSAVAPGASLVLVLGFMIATTWAVALGGAAGNNRLALLGGLRLAGVRSGTLLAAALGLVAISRQLGSLSLDAIAHLQTFPAFAYLTGKGIPSLGLVVSPLGTVVVVIALAVLSQRMSPTRPDLALDLVDGYNAAASGPILLAHRMFEILELIAHGALLATFILGSTNLPFLGNALEGHWLLPYVEVTTVIVKTVLGCLLLLVCRRLIPPLSMEQATRVSWLALVPLAALSVLIPRDVLIRLWW